jgi:hypothetical protein
VRCSVFDSGRAARFGCADPIDDSSYSRSGRSRSEISHVAIFVMDMMSKRRSSREAQLDEGRGHKITCITIIIKLKIEITYTQN